MKRPSARNLIFLFANACLLFGGFWVGERLFKATKPDRNQVSYVGNPAVSQETSSGENLYKRHCQSCHGLKAVGANGPKLTSLFLQKSAEEVAKLIITGNIDKGMPSWGDHIDDVEMQNLLQYLRSLQEPPQ